MLRLLLVDWDDTELVRRNIGHLRRMNAERLAAAEALDPPRERGRRLQELGVRFLTETIRWCDETEASLPPPSKG